VLINILPSNQLVKFMSKNRNLQTTDYRLQTTFEIQPLGSAKEHVLVQHDKEYRGAFCGIVDKDGGKHQHIYSEKSSANSSTN